MGGRESFKLWALCTAARFSDPLTPPLSEAPWFTLACSLALDTCSLHFHLMTLSAMSLREQGRAREFLPVPTITNPPLPGFMPMALLLLQCMSSPAIHSCTRSYPFLPTQGLCSCSFVFFLLRQVLLLSTIIPASIQRYSKNLP